MKSRSGLARPLRCLALAGIAALAATTARAEWSNDPGLNMVVADDAGGASQPHIVAAPDGGFYVSWNSSASGGFDIRLQRLDAEGNEVWPHGGVLVADRSLAFTYDYGLAVDASGNAYVSYNCCVNTPADEYVAVNKVLPDGSLAWGANGVTLQTGATDRVYAAYVTVASDGNAVVAWSADAGSRAQKLDASGNPLWAAGGVLLSQGSGVKLLADIKPSLNGDVIASWSNQSGSARVLRAQRLASANGAPQWGTAGIQVFGQGNLQSGYFPKFIADGAGGALFYDYDIIGTTFYVRVQRVDAAGDAMFDPNGVLATTDTTIQHGAPAAAFDASTGSTYIVWRDATIVSGGAMFDGLSAQRIDAGGNRMWTDTGRVIVPLTDSTNGTNTISQLTAAPAVGDVIVSWTRGAIPAPDQPITAMRLDPTGAAVWPQEAVVVKSQGETGRTSVVPAADGFLAYVFDANTAGAGTSVVAAQNLNLDGSLGIVDMTPANDHWNAAIAIPPVTPATPFTTTEAHPATATVDATDPGSPCINPPTGGVSGTLVTGFNTLWYTYTTGSTAEYVNLDTAGSLYYNGYNVNTGSLFLTHSPISVFTGEPGAFRLVAGGCNQSSSAYGSPSLLAGLRLEPDTTYSIAVASTVALWSEDPPASAPSAPTLTLTMSSAPTYTVDRLDDPLPAATSCDAGNCSIRAAINAANAVPGAIFIPAGTYAMTATSTNEDANADGDFDLGASTSIYGAGRDQTIIQGPSNDRVLDLIRAGVGVTGVGQTNRIEDLALRGPGDPAFGGTGTYTFGGGLLRSRSSSFPNFTSLVRTELSNGYTTNGSDNPAGFRAGGAAQFLARGEIVDSDIHDNTGLNGGGLGILTISAPFEIRGTTIRNNRATNTGLSTAGNTFGGGGVLSSTALTIVDSTIANNRSNGDGGGLSTGMTGLANQAKAQIRSSTIAGNIADADGTGGGAGGGVMFGRTSGVDVYNSILSGNTVGTTALASDCTGDVPAAVSPSLSGYNLVGTFTGAACAFDAANDDLIGLDPLLGALADNGGPTLTMALVAGSPAVDAGNPAGCTDATGMPIASDQRGMPRVGGLRCDIGAYELNSSLPTPEVPVLEPASDSGTSDSDNLTNVVQPTIEGTCEAGPAYTVHVQVDGTDTTSAQCSTAAYQAVIGPLADGIHQVAVYAVDANGVPTGLSPPLAITIDTQTNAAITSGPNDPSMSADAMFVVESEAGNTLICTLDALAPAACVSPMVHGGLAAGQHTFVVEASDAAGNHAMDGWTWTIIAPAAPGAPLLDAASDSGASNTDGITNAAMLAFHGSCGQDGDQIQLLDAGSEIGSPSTCLSGAYAVNLAGVTEGAHSISAIAARGGVDSAQSASFEIVVDRTAPTAPVVLSPTPPVEAPFTLTGEAEAGSTVVVAQVASTACTTMADGGGQWSCAIGDTTDPDFQITATDVAGNTSVMISWSAGAVVEDAIFRNGFEN